MTRKNPYAALDAFVEKGLSKLFTHAEHLRFDHMVVFVRVSTRFVDGQKTRALDVASVDVDEAHQNKKVFSTFLNYVERLAQRKGIPVYVESILNEDLQAALSRRGYHMTGEPCSPCATFKIEQLNEKYSADVNTLSP